MRTKMKRKRKKKRRRGLRDTQKYTEIYRDCRITTQSFIGVRLTVKT